MRAVVVYESVSAGLPAVAQYIADGVTARGATVDTVAAAEAPLAFARRVDLLVVGAAAPAVGLPEQPTRTPPAGGSGADSDGHGRTVWDWLERILLAPGQPTATFDLRVERPGSPASAARAAARRLRERGATIIGSQSFRVQGPAGPLVDGEPARTRAWAAGLVVDAAIHRVG